MDFWTLVRVVAARRYFLLGLMAAALLCVLVAFVVGKNSTPYVAEANVLPSARAMNPGGLTPDAKDAQAAPTYDRFSRLALFTTRLASEQDEALELAGRPAREQKRVVARALSNQLTPAARDAVLSPDAPDTLIDSTLSLFRVPTGPEVWTPRTVTPELREQVRDGLEAAPVSTEAVNQTPGGSAPTPTLTDFLSVRVRAPGPEMAQQLATLTAAAFVNSYADTSRAEGQSALSRALLAKQQAARGAALSQDRLTAFQKRSRLLDMARQVPDAVADLSELRRARDKAEVDAQAAAQAAAQYKAAAREATPQTRVALDPAARPQAQTLSAEIGQDTAALQTLADTLTPDNPRFQHAQASLSAKKKELAALLRQPYIVAQVNPQYNLLKSQAADASARAASAQASVRKLGLQIASLELSNATTLPDAQKRMATLQNNLDSALADKKAADAAYRALLTQSRQQDNGLITLTRPAAFALPDRTGPGLAALLLYAAVLSGVLGVGLSMLLHALDRRIQTPGDAARLLGMPVTAVIPTLPDGDSRSQARVALADPLSPYAESYRLLRTDLLLAAGERPFQSVMCATAKPGQGATTTLCNLAVALAQAGKRVILIDADLRRPKLHGFFGTTNEIGLSSLLQGECETEEALKQTDVDNLLLLPSGPLPLNPSELLASQRMRTLHERLKPHTDFVLIDTPSAIAFSDSAILASFVDSVLVVVRAQEVPRGGERGVAEMLARARARVVGVVLNGVQPQLVDSLHYHAAYYPPVAENGPKVLPAPTAGYEPTLMGATLVHRAPPQDERE